MLPCHGSSISSAEGEQHWMRRITFIMYAFYIDSIVCPWSCDWTVATGWAAVHICIDCTFYWSVGVLHSGFTYSRSALEMAFANDEEWSCCPCTIKRKHWWRRCRPRPGIQRAEGTSAVGCNWSDISWRRRERKWGWIGNCQFGCLSVDELFNAWQWDGDIIFNVIEFRNGVMMKVKLESKPIVENVLVRLEPILGASTHLKWMDGNELMITPRIKRWYMYQNRMEKRTESHFWN